MTNPLKYSTPLVTFCKDSFSSGILEQIDSIESLVPKLSEVSNPIYEYHLGLPEHKIDFAVDLNPTTKEREIIAKYYSTLSENNIWCRIGDFCECWADPNSAVYDNVYHIWLEFDLDKKFDGELASAYPEPSFFFSPIGIEGGNDQTSDIFRSKRQWVDDALGLLMGNSLSVSLKKILSHCFASLPLEASIYQIGVMLPRESECQSIRLCVKNISADHILKLLGDLDWLGCFDELKSLLNDLSGFVDEINLSFSVENVINTKIGLECYLHDSSTVESISRWRLLLEYLVINKLCSSREAESLLAWSKSAEIKGDISKELVNSQKGLAFVHPHFRSFLIKKINHIKVVYQPCMPLVAKAYLSASHVWLSNNGLVTAR